MMNALLIFWTLIVPAFTAVHESISSVPLGWTKASISPRSDQTVQLKVSLKHQALDELESLLREVSDPTSKQYGQYLSQAELDAKFKPADDAESAVRTWLADSGAQNIVSLHNDLLLTVSIDQADTMFETKFESYTNGATLKFRTTQYSIPDELHQYIDFVSPTIYFETLRPADSRMVSIPTTPSKRDIDASCLDLVPLPDVDNKTTIWLGFGPRCMSQQYNIAGYVPDPSSGSSIAFGSFAHQSASFSDLEIYEDKLNLTKSNFTKLASINNGTVGQDPNVVIQYEANLDVQIIAGLVGGLPYGEYSTGGAGPLVPNDVFPNETYNWNEPFLEYFEYLVSQPDSDLPWVISHSYADYENIVPLKYAQRVCNLIGMLGLRGRTILNASGDLGVGQICKNNVEPFEPQFASQFPGSCPYVTTVGGTQSFNPEIAWNESSGGFSFYFPQPWYQKDAIEKYLENHIDADTKECYESNNYTNFKGRGFPDISAHSMYPWIPTVLDGRLELGGGTSASCPTVASVIALINDARFRNGQPAVGFANPWLYSIAADALTDITSGGITGCLGPFFNPYIFENITDAPFIPYATWNATVGWDPVTGLGTPDFTKMKDLTPKASAKRLH